MRIIEQKIYTFEELSEKAKDRVRDYFSDDAHLFDPLESTEIFTAYLKKLAYAENSQGPYWYNSPHDVFASWFNDNAGQIKKEFKRIENIELYGLDKAFFEDLQEFKDGMEYCIYSGFYFLDNKCQKFYADNTLKEFWDQYYSNWEWIMSDEYLIDICEANNYEFTENGELI